MLLLNGDCIEQMQKLKDEGKQIDSVVTDPPYHLTSIVERYGKEGSAPAKDKDGLYQRQARGFMGKEWDGGDIAFRTDTWKLAYDLLKPGGYLLAFSASRNYHRMAVAIEDAGFEIRDQIMWIYGSGFPKSLNVGDGWGTALKPAHEPIVMARKPLEGTNKQNIEKYGTGGINIDGCRIETDEKLNIGSNNRENGVVNFGMKDNKDSQKQNELGRYPANLMHDGLQEEWARYFYCPKTSSAERNRGLDNFEEKVGIHGNKWTDQDYRKGETKPTTARKNIHPTVKPQELMKYLCRLVTPKGGVVLDPFMGSGSTGMAAKDEGFDFIGIEKEQEYFEIAEARIKVSSPLMEFM